MRASRMSSAAGAKVGLVELPYNAVSSATQGGLGGTCVIRGCVPKKLLVYGSGFETEFRDAKGFGWDHGTSMPSFSWEKLISAKTDEIERLNGIYGRILDNNGVEKFEGSGKVTGAHSVEVTSVDGTKKTYTAKVRVARFPNPDTPFPPPLFEYTAVIKRRYHTRHECAVLPLTLVTVCPSIAIYRTPTLADGRD